MTEQVPPRFQLDTASLPLLGRALTALEQGFATLPPADLAPPDLERLDAVLSTVAERMRDNYPYFHPQYAGQMLKPPHPVARLAYALALWVNPNNHSLDGGRASSAMEREAVAGIARMIGWPTHLGHLTGGGTMANLEALWVAGQRHPGGLIVASAQAHYTHQRISAVLGLGFRSVPTDRLARMDVTALEELLQREKIGTVVVTMGTTAVGSVDPLPRILELRNRYRFRIHADAAYGGYFGLAGNLGPAAREAFDRLSEVDSLVIDPHKHGLQPYGCGCVLFPDVSVGQLYQHDSPYTYFSSTELHLGEITLECSRPGAAAVALWATQELLPLIEGGEFARMLDRSRAAALEWHRRLVADPRFVAGLAPELDIVVWAVREQSASAASRRARQIFAEAARRNLHLALAELPAALIDPTCTAFEHDQPTVTTLRSVLMKPEHLDWVDRLWELLDGATVATG
ncbi:MAG: aminotransferase class I/II-fold pyridoxal phosphate-dependent enzyme [Gemmatimonadales bacterium]